LHAIKICPGGPLPAVCYWQKNDPAVIAGPVLFFVIRLIR
jgi:hypothetical protein